MSQDSGGTEVARTDRNSITQSKRPSGRSPHATSGVAAIAVTLGVVAAVVHAPGIAAAAPGEASATSESGGDTAGPQRRGLGKRAQAADERRETKGALTGNRKGRTERPARGTVDVDAGTGAGDDSTTASRDDDHSGPADETSRPARPFKFRGVSRESSAPTGDGDVARRDRSDVRPVSATTETVAVDVSATEASTHASAASSQPSQPEVPAKESPFLLGILAWARRQSAATVSTADRSHSNSITSTAIPASAALTAVPVGDSTAYLQDLFDGLTPGQTLTLQPGTYQHSGNLYVRVPGVTIDGAGAVLEATNPATSAVLLIADDVTFTNFDIRQAIGQARNDKPYRAGLVVGNRGVTVRNVSVTGGSTVGVFVIGASNFLLDSVTVQDTASDGIQMYAGANNGVVKNARVLRSGDDGIAVVSYLGDAISTNISIISPYVEGTWNTRGLVVSGGSNITFTDITVKNTALSGVFVGSQTGGLPTASATNIVIDGGTITNGNYSMGYATGAVTVYNDNPLAAVRGVRIANLTIIDTPKQARSNILHLDNGGGGIGSVVYSNIAVKGRTDLPVILTNVKSGYTLSNIRLNGVTVTSNKISAATLPATGSCTMLSRLFGKCSTTAPMYGVQVDSALRF